ncbi:pantoate--beta-alanine ligase [Kiloniella laminariae]|uniref:Pantothenate synthetase n=1 Tax=Kiloniella laminariae TaxID=454162 RepID=A0ABT4LKX6_9PROT|nr:pantoate--beta-alanine ligase [Kiloniella laminariae]MCZ4281610.1 pantoate--beta-alanine ligase [Kiloniella laminariae]
MQIVKTRKELKRLLVSWKTAGEELGVVMTMGALHAGHLGLVEAAGKDNDKVVATIFVNPRQFDNKNDLASYPVDTEEDLKKLKVAGVDAVYLPQAGEMYPDGYSTTVSVASMQDCLCGAARPGHMDGVTTVVTKLLIQISPDRAYFGQKDFQQYLLIQRVVRDLDLPVDIIGVPTYREEDRLAMSSRNRRLDAAQRKIAPTLYQVQSTIRDLVLQGETIDHVLEWGEKVILDAGFDRIDYLELRSEDNLALITETASREAVLTSRIFVAAWLGTTRLIDNLSISR